MIKLFVVFIAFIIAVDLEPVYSRNSKFQYSIFVILIILEVYIPLQFKRLLIYSYTIACRDYSSLCSPSIKWQCRFNSFIRYRCQKTCNICGKISYFRYYENILNILHFYICCHGNWISLISNCRRFFNKVLQKL